MTKITGGVKINTYKNSVFLRRAEDVCSRRQRRISDGEMKVMVPVDSVERVGLRHVIENDDIDAVEKVLEERPDNYNKAITWNRRVNMYLEKMKSGNVFEVADVIRTLQVQENEKKLSTGERRLLGTARQILISEVMLVKNAEQQDIENWLNKFF